MSAPADHNIIGGDGAHRSKYRKEVKRYHQRRQNVALRTEASARDQHLFLFSDGARTRKDANTHQQQELLEGQQQALLPTTVPSPFLATDDDQWDFDFIFRAKPLLSTELLGSSETTTCSHENAIVPPSFFAEMGQTLVPKPHEEKKAASPLSVLVVPPTSLAPSTSTKITSSVHVQRVEGVPPIPVDRPMPSGTNLNIPTRNYLTLDSKYYIHQHAPGFARDRNEALQSLLGSAVRSWKDVTTDGVLVLSTGDAMRAVFEQRYNDDKPLALQVKRIGPAIVIDAHSDAPTSVRGMRERALLGKALYRLKEEGTLPTTASEAENAGVVALPQTRVGSGAVMKHTKGLSRYSQILRWDIDSLEVLVGVDSPIVLDRRNNTEQMVKLEDVTEPLTPAEMQRDVLNCWFDATLANVPQVGIYIHNAGVVQRYEVKKVQELLGLVEGRIATAAMDFTSNVLQWLVRHCVKDDSTYAVIRGYGSDYLELYELPKKTHRNTRDSFASFMDDDRSGRTSPTPPTHGTRDDGAECGGVGNNTSFAHGAEADKQRRDENDRLNLNLARMCFGMGKHLFNEGGVRKAYNAIALLLRSFVIFLQQCTVPGAKEAVEEIVQMLPVLVGRLIAASQVPPPTSPGLSAAKSPWNEVVEGEAVPPGHPARSRDEGGASAVQDERLASTKATPEEFREALVTCGRFEVRLRQALRDPSLSLSERQFYVHCLLPCSAALCVVLARTLEAFSAERDACMKMRKVLLAKSKGKSLAAGDEDVAGREAYQARSVRTKDLLQVVVEGLVRLEQVNHVIERLAQENPTPSSSTSPPPPPSPPDDGSAPREDEKGKEQHADGIVVDPTTRIDPAPLSAALCELFGDVVLLTMADTTPFTANVINEISRSIMQRWESERSGVDCAAAGYSTLQWLCALTPDVVSLSFTALRFYTKAGSQTKRHLLKTAQTYYYVGRYHFQTDRYTKSLEALHRAKSLFKASLKAPNDAVFGECFLSTSIVQYTDVLRTLGDVYASLVSLKARSSSATVTAISPNQPLSIGRLHVMSPEEEQFIQNALDAYTNGECSEKKGCVMIHYAGAQIDAVTLSGEPADAAKTKHIFALLQEATNLVQSPTEQRRREWEVLRLMTASSVGRSGVVGPLVKEAEEIVQRWSTALMMQKGLALQKDDARSSPAPPSTETAVTVAVADTDTSLPSATPSPYSPSAFSFAYTLTSVEEQLQLALVCCVLSEHHREQRQASSRSAKKRSAHGASGEGFQRRQWARQMAAQLTTALDTFEGMGPAHMAETKLRWTLRSWRITSPVEWVYRMTSMMVLRVLRATKETLPAKTKAEANSVFERLIAMEKAMGSAGASPLPPSQTGTHEEQKRQEGGGVVAGEEEGRTAEVLTGLREALKPLLSW